MTRPVLAALVFTALVLAGCGGEDASDTPARGGEPVEVLGGEYAFVVPERLTGGVVSMNFRNIGSELHEFVLARLHDGKTAEDAREALAAVKPGQDGPDWLEDMAGVPLVSPGREVRLTRVLDEGTYALICSFLSQKGVPHYKLGMVQGFEIEGDSEREVPLADAVVTARHAEMEVPQLSAGRHVLELRNAAGDARGFDLITFKPRNRHKIAAWAANNFRGPPPATYLGALHAVPPGTTAWLDVTFRAGQTYVIYDDASGIRHEFRPR